MTSTFRLNPRNDPINISGTDIPKYSDNNANRVVKGIAALDPAPHRNRFNIKNTLNTIPGTNEAVIIILVFHRRPPMTNNRERIINIINSYK